MIPKNKRRVINVKGIEYEWCCKECGGQTQVYIKNMLSKNTFHWNGDHVGSITPADVREFIVTNKV